MAAAEAKIFSKVRSNYALNLAPSKNEATIDIFGVIGIWWDGVESKQFVEDIKALDVDEITINISSPGGFVDDGLMIYDAIRSHRARVTARLSGLVASAATWIACAADKVIASDTLLYMIHNVQGVAVGTKDDMRKAADLNEKMEDVIINLYRKKTGQRKSQLQKWLDAETWFTVDEAIENGFVDEKGDGFRFEYESSISDTETRNFMTNALNCASLPALEVPTNSQTDNNNMSEFTKEQKSFLERLFGSNKATKETPEASAQNNEIEALRQEVADLKEKLEAANKASDKANFDTLINGITNAIKPQIEEVAQEAAEAVKTELTEAVNAVDQKVENVTEKVGKIDAVTKKVEEVAQAVNEQKSLSPQPETKEDNGEGLVDVVAPVNTFQAFVKNKVSNN